MSIPIKYQKIIKHNYFFSLLETELQCYLHLQQTIIISKNIVLINIFENNVVTLFDVIAEQHEKKFCLI